MEPLRGHAQHKEAHASYEESQSAMTENQKNSAEDTKKKHKAILTEVDGMLSNSQGLTESAMAEVDKRLKSGKEAWEVTAAMLKRDTASFQQRLQDQQKTTEHKLGQGKG